MTTYKPEIGPPITETQATLVECFPDELGRWVIPLQLGGRDGSNHSAILAALVRKGYVQRQHRSAAWSRPSYKYRLTPSGYALRSWLNRATTAEQATGDE